MKLKYIAIYEALQNHQDGVITAKRSRAEQGDREEQLEVLVLTPIQWKLPPSVTQN